MVDFKSIDLSGKYNFHSHTQFCDGRARMEEFAKAAAEQCFTHYGFSPHSPIPFASPCNMSVDDVPLYLDEVARLKTIYADRVNLYASMEIDYVEGWGPAHPYFQQLPLDYRIGSVHFIPSFDNDKEFIDIDGSFENFKVKMEKYFYNDIKRVVESFYQQSMHLVEDGHFDIIGHFDKIAYNASCYSPGIENERWYEGLVMRLFEAIMDHHYIIEINTKAWEKQQRFFPHHRFFELLKKFNAPVLFNSDAHFPELINAGRDEAISMFNNS